MTECLCREKSIFGSMAKPIKDFEKYFSTFKFTYNEEGKITSAMDPSTGAITEYKYDEEGNFYKTSCILVGNDVFGLVDSGIIVEEFYDKCNNLTKRIFNGKTTFSGYYEDGRIIRSVDANNGCVFYLYKADNSKTYFTMVRDNENIKLAYKLVYDISTNSVRAHFINTDRVVLFTISKGKFDYSRNQKFSVLIKQYTKDKDREVWYEKDPLYSEPKVVRERTSAQDILYYSDRTGYYKRVQHANGSMELFVSSDSCYSYKLCESYDADRCVYKKYKNERHSISYVKSEDFGEFDIRSNGIVKKAILYFCNIEYDIRHDGFYNITTIHINDNGCNYKLKPIMVRGGHGYELEDSNKNIVGFITRNGVLTELNYNGHNFKLEFDSKWIVSKYTEITDFTISEWVYNKNGFIVGCNTKVRNR